MKFIGRRSLFIVGITLFSLAWFGTYSVVHANLEAKIPAPVRVNLPAPHHLDEALKPYVEKYKLYGVNLYLNPQYNWQPQQWGYYLNGDIYVRQGDFSLDVVLNHEYVHYKQQKSPAIDWRPMYDSNYVVRQRMLTFYPEYNAAETEAVFCTEVRNLPQTYLDRCNFLLPNRSAIPFYVN